MDMSMDSWLHGPIAATTTTTTRAVASPVATPASTKDAQLGTDTNADAASEPRASRSKELLDDLPSLAALKDTAWVRKLASSSRKLVTNQQKQSTATSSEDESSAERAASVRRRSSLSPAQSPQKITQSVLVPAYDDDLLATLDPRFFTERFDAVAHVLDILPTNRNDLDAFLRTEISAVDVARDVVVAKLAADVRANQDAFIQGMKQVQEVDLDLVRAQIHVKNGRRLLASAKSDLIISSLEIVKIKRNRDRVEEIIDHGDHVLRYFEEEQRMTRALRANSFTTAVDICIGLRKQLASAKLEKLQILQKLTHRVHDFIPELRQQFDKSLRAVAERFDPLQYKELLHAYITLAEHSEHLGFEFSATRLSDVLANIPDVVVRCIDDLTRDALAELFAPPRSQSQRRTSPSHSKKSSKKNGAKRTSSKPRKAKKRSNDVANNPAVGSSASSSTLSPAAQAIEDVTRGFERLTDLMHTYYLLVQWHRDPFNPRNDDVAYLHRCGIDDDDDHDDDDDEDDDGDDDGDDDDTADELERRSSSHSDAAASVDKSVGAKLKRLLSPRAKRSNSVASDKSAGASASSASTQRSLYSHVLCETGMTLLRYRKIVWENMQQTVMEVLDRMDMTYGFKMEHIIALSHATSTFVEIGEEFTGAATTKLRSCIRTKCEQYLNALHDDNMELLRMLLDTENWQRVTTNLEHGDTAAGLLHMIETRSGYRFATKARDKFALHPIYTRRVFPTFMTAGNPFAAANTTTWLSLANGIRFQYETTRPVVEKVVDDDDDDGDNNNAVGTDSDTREIVFNSSTLAGFIRFCGVYLKMMEHLPTIAWDILRMLHRLFEFYAYAVFTGFTDRDALLALLESRSDGTGGSDGTDDLGRYSGLKHNMCRIADDMLAGETYVQTTVALSTSSTLSVDTMNSVAMVDKTVTLRRITRVPTALDDASERNLFALAERVIASEVVSAQARLLEAIEAPARSYLPERFHCLLDELYARNAVVATELRSFTIQNLAVKLVDPPSLLRAVASVAWDIAYMHERPNEYVVALVQKCGEAWGGLQILADGSIPAATRDAIWSAVVQTIFATLLQAFSTVSKCTPQGRALMSMDLYALQNGLDLINHVSTAAVPRGHAYVNDYIKAFYLDDANDVLAWIKEHKDAYTKLQFVNLIRNGVGPKMDRKELRAFVLQVDDVLTRSP